MKQSLADPDQRFNVFGVTIKARCLKINPSGFTVSYLKSAIWNTPFSLWPCLHPLEWITAANLHQFQTEQEGKRLTTADNDVSETKGLAMINCWVVFFTVDCLIPDAASFTCKLKVWKRCGRQKNCAHYVQFKVPRQFQIEGCSSFSSLIIFSYFIFFYVCSWFL